MEQIVSKFINRHKLIRAGSVIVVGVSGGPDSMALLNYLYHNQSLWHVRVIACTVDHMLRGDESAGDLDYVKEVCLRYDILFEGRQVDVNAYKKRHGLSTQVAARECRYDVFKSVMNHYQATYLALAHHGDDQIETMLMRQVNGSFGAARSGIPYRRPFANGFIIRPFLTVTKAMIEDYCQNQAIIPRRDPSNNSSTYVRNRFRKHILPFLKEENPMVHLRFQQESEILREDQLFLEDMAKNYLAQVILSKDAEEMILSVSQMIKIPLPLQRRLIHLILNYLYSIKGYDGKYQSIHIQEILFMLNDKKASGQLHLPDGLVIMRSYDQCIFSFHSHHTEFQPYEYTIEIPGILQTPIGELHARMETKVPEDVKGQHYFICDFNQIQLPLIVRNRRNGDRVSLKGMNGTKKVKDIFIDQKTPQDKRGTWPIITDSNGKILWLPLLKQSSYGKITRQTDLFLILSFVTYG